MHSGGHASTSHWAFRISAAVVAFGILAAAGAFVWQVWLYTHAIRNGDARDLLDRRREASISSTIANANVTAADLAQLIPTGIFPELGPRQAPITIVEFVDYQCPFCQRSAPAVRRLAATSRGQVRLIIRDFPITSLHPTAMQSAVAARCVLAHGQKAYWRFHDLLYSDITAHTPEQLRAWAQAAGAPVDAFTRCTADDRVRAQVESDMAVGLRVGVAGTPTFFVNGVKFQGALDDALLSQVIIATLKATP